MGSINVYRKDRELRGKELSANTIASFLVAQSVRIVPDLEAGEAMSSEMLLFLNRDRAMGYWIQQGWLRQDADSFCLTDEGLNEIELRESDTARGSSGRKKPGNVSAQLILSAYSFIKNGCSDSEEPVLSDTFEQ